MSLKPYTYHLQKLVNEWRTYYWFYKMYNRAPDVYLQAYNVDDMESVRLNYSSPDDFYLNCISRLERVEKKLSKYNIFAIVRAHRKFDARMIKLHPGIPPSLQSQGRYLSYREYKVPCQSQI